MTTHNSELAHHIDGESKSKVPQYLAASLATLSAVSVGTSLGWTSPTIPLLENDHVLDSAQSAWVGSLMTVGGFLGALPAGYIVNKLGRKRTLMLINIPLIISWVLICTCVSTSLHVSWAVLGLYIARFLVGLAAGIVSVAASMYISEIAENSVRGTLGTFYQLQLTVGILFAYVVGLADDVLLISLICGVIPFIFIATFMFMPESPVYLLSKNQNEEAKKSLQWFRGPDYQIQYELKHMQDMINESQQNEASLVDLLSDFITVKALFIVLGLMVFQQLSGVNAVIFYTATIFSSAGSSLPAVYASIVIGVVQVIATYSSSLLIEKAGRRVLLLLSNIVMGLCLALLGSYFHLQAQDVDVSSWSWLPLVSLAVYMVVFSLGYGPIPWIIMGELVPTNLKGISSALAACTSWLLAFIVTNNFGDLVSTFGEAKTFWGFSIICMTGAMFVAALLPETKGKDIQVILEELGKKPSTIRLQSTKVQSYS